MGRAPLCRLIARAAERSKGQKESGFMKLIKIAALLAVYAFDVLLLGLIEKLAKGLIKKLTALSAAAEQTVSRINAKRAALKAQR